MKPTELVAILVRGTLVPSILRRTMYRDGATVILYHDISAKLFREHIRYLERRYRFVSIDQLVDAVLGGPPLPKHALVITLDDGHVGNFRELLPVLKQQPIPLCIFACADICGTHQEFWWKKVIRLNKLVAPEKRQDLQAMKLVPDEERRARVEELASLVDQDFRERTALNREELLELADVGITVGAHTMDHPCLVQCSDEESQRQITQSRVKLREWLGMPIDHFSYPNGGYSDREVEYVKQAGFKSAITTAPGPVGPRTDPFQINRVSLHDEDDVNRIAVKTTGLWEMVRKAVRGTQ